MRRTDLELENQITMSGGDNPPPTPPKKIKKKGFKNLGRRLLTVPVNARVCNVNAAVVHQADVLQLHLRGQQQVFHFGRVERHERDRRLVWIFCRLHAGHLDADRLLEVAQKTLQLYSKRRRRTRNRIRSLWKLKWVIIYNVTGAMTIKHPPPSL